MGDMGIGCGYDAFIEEIDGLKKGNAHLKKVVIMCDNEIMGYRALLEKCFYIFNESHHASKFDFVAKEIDSLLRKHGF